MERTSPLGTLDSSTQGWINGFIGVVIFSGSLPATRLAVMEFDPVFLTMIRATLAALLGLCLLGVFKEKRPTRQQSAPLVIVALGVVIGFPLLTALALQYVTSAHSIVFIGLLPLATAVFGVLRGGERPRPVFWLFSILGSLLLAPSTLSGISLPAWLSLGYVAVFSMLIGFVFWYRGLAQGGIAAVGQLQLLQPFFGLALAAGLLHEQVSLGMVLVTVAVIGCVAGAKKFAR
ncbi:DMT family transporter [Pseudomonas sp. 22072]|uniref:DMT family transporter n=1 Tax=Pseudomonas sp. 22072 TaxID=3453865 RepID=UPI003F845F92